MVSEISYKLEDTKQMPMLEVSFVSLSSTLVILANKRLDWIILNSNVVSIDLILPK